MANKWMKKLGLGMSVIMTVSQLSTGMVFAAPEDDGWDDNPEMEDDFDDFEDIDDLDDFDDLDTEEEKKEETAEE